LLESLTPRKLNLTVNIQKADPKERRKAIVSVIIGAIAGTSLFFLLELALGNVSLWIQKNALFLVVHHYVGFLAMLVLVSPILWITIYLILFTKKIIISQRFPPPNMPVIRDVRVLEGKSAVRRGRLLQVLCWFILIPAAMIPFLVWFILYSISYTS